MAIEPLKNYLTGLFSSLVLLLGLSGCSGDADDFLEAIELIQSQVQSIQISALRTRTQLGESLSYTAQALHADGETIDFTSKVSWRTSDEATATISSEGAVTTLNTGDVQILASFGGLAASSLLTINNATLQQLALSGDTNEIDVCKTTQLGATGSYSDGSNREIRDLVDWAVDAGSDATIENDAATKGSIVPTVSKQITVTVSKGNDISPVPVLISVKPTLNSITIAASSSGDLSVNDTRQYTATGSYSSTTEGENITNIAGWNSSVESVASVNTSGLLTALAVGSTAVTANCGEQSSKSITASVTDSTKDKLEFLINDEIKTSFTQTNSTDLNITLQSVTSSDTTTDRTDAATWTIINTNPSTMAVEISATGKVTYPQGEGQNGNYQVQAEFNGIIALLPVTVGLGPPDPPVQN